jgi:DNA-binding transcriptional regulator YiaG
MSTWQIWRRKTMAKARNFRELETKMSPESRARVAARVKETLENMSLDQLRAARELTQEHLAALLGIKQASISKMERRTDMYIGTLSRFIEAMGGQLEIRACFPDGSVRITQFSEKTPGDLTT